MTERERFEAKTAPAADLSPNGMSGCVLWTASSRPTPRGARYGKFGVAGKTTNAHAVAWRLAGRTVPTGLQLDHLCRRTLCVNPDHLEPVTSAENTRRGARALLTLECASEIRCLAANGWGRGDIAAAYGVSKSTVSDIHRGLTWT